MSSKVLWKVRFNKALSDILGNFLNLIKGGRLGSPKLAER